ncbi:MAG: OmpA family protein [Polyangiaceae bacterium]|nr:OmpA family protein [Polyangiaceae bacterium]
MKKALFTFGLSAALLATLVADASAEPGRFDAQTFRPSAAPRDLVMVRKSEIIGHASPVVGIFSDLAFDPLVLVDKGTNEAIDVVSTRLTLTAMAGIGLGNWIDITAALPIIAFQDGGNLRRIGTEGEVKPQALGDLRLEAKLGLPFLHRKDQVKEGFGAALYGNVNLPTGDVMAFASDGVVTGGGGVILDYRFNFGLLLAANGGVWLRPDRQFAGVRVGNMASFGVAAEMYVLQRYGISVVGEVFGYPSLVSFPNDPTQIPAEGLLGIRWQSKWGLTITVGGSFGAACSFGAPGLRFWSSITWQPNSSREQQEINRLMEKDSLDPDKDGLIGDADKCPQAPGRPENQGCPDVDTDADGVSDREDDCPDLPSNARGKGGCPGAFVKGDEIVIMDQVHFATDKDVILDESKPMLEDVATVLLRHPEIREIEIEGHTDIRAGDAYNKALSQRRVNSVLKYLEGRGIESARLKATGYGHSKPLYDDSGCVGADEDLTPTCRFMTSKNRRVVFHITKRGAPPPKAIVGADNNPTTLPTKDSNLPSDGVLQKDSTLPTKKDSVLPNQGVLPKSEEKQLPKGDDTQLPKQDTALPKEGVLPNAGQPKKLPTNPTKPADPPKKDDGKPAPDAPK